MGVMVNSQFHIVVMISRFTNAYRSEPEYNIAILTHPAPSIFVRYISMTELRFMIDFERYVLEYRKTYGVTKEYILSKLE